MMVEWWWAYLALGAFVGFFGGLLGIGGGALMVPVLVFIYTAKGFAPEHVVHLALGTGIATIIFTSASSVWSHHRRRSVNWGIFMKMMPGVAIGTFGGAYAAGWIDPRLLAAAFTLLIFGLAAQMMADTRPAASGTLPGPAVMATAGGVIGLLSSLSATGGAALTVSFLARGNVRIHEAIGTASALGWPLAVMGTLGYVLSGFGKPGLPEWGTGYVYLPALAWIAAASVALAPLGARVAHRTQARPLKRVFAVVMFLLAANMLVSTFL
jgi:uncharacterized membrane protein YfcA